MKNKNHEENSERVLKMIQKCLRYNDHEIERK